MCLGLHGYRRTNPSVRGNCHVPYVLATCTRNNDARVALESACLCSYKRYLEVASGPDLGAGVFTKALLPDRNTC